MDNTLTSGKSSRIGKNIEGLLTRLRDVAVKTNKDVASKLGIPQSTAVTTVTVSYTHLTLPTMDSV